MEIPITICLFTSTKGHWGIKTRYLETLTDFNNQLPLASFSGLHAHIKISPGEELIAQEIKRQLEQFGFSVLETLGSWSHNRNHQEEYLKDISKVFLDPMVNKYHFSLFLEDDFKLVCWRGKLIDYLAKATSILNENSEIVSVRIARGINEKQRIIGLREKHNIDSYVAESGNDGYFFASDFSNNPHIVRTRDMRNAMIVLNKVKGFPMHSEHGTASALKLFSNSKTPIAILDMNDIVARHIGSPIGEEEPIDRHIYL